jgi:demethylmenaquinone methyltransferase/2-methoxy-6-polyprenyl-1,4-benzoquinol methylase
MTLPKPENKATYVQEMFQQIAPKYDLMNDLITGGLHRLWKLKVKKMLNLSAGQPVLDLCCGTGDLSALMAESGAEVVAVDFAPEMLKIAETKRAKPNLRFQQADILNLPFADQSFERAIISFGLRNVADYQKALKEIKRVCKPAAIFIILDLSHPQGFWKAASSFYRFKLLPWLGKIFAGNQAAYGYLPNSIQNYPDQKSLSQMLADVGFQEIEYQNILGGLIAIHRAIA